MKEKYFIARFLLRENNISILGKSSDGYLQLKGVFHITIPETLNYATES
jgi:hypothetical protein